MAYNIPSFCAISETMPQALIQRLVAALWQNCLPGFSYSMCFSVTSSPFQRARAPFSNRAIDFPFSCPAAVGPLSRKLKRFEFSRCAYQKDQLTHRSLSLLLYLPSLLSQHGCVQVSCITWNRIIREPLQESYAGHCHVCFMQGIQSAGRLSYSRGNGEGWDWPPYTDSLRESASVRVTIFLKDGDIFHGMPFQPQRQWMRHPEIAWSTCLWLTCSSQFFCNTNSWLFQSSLWF